MNNRRIDRFAGLAFRAALLAVRDRWRSAQPTCGNPSPTAGSETSQKANAAADQTIYKPVEYVEREEEGPGAGRDPRRDQEQQRDVPAEVHRQQHRRLRRDRAVQRQLPGARALQPRARCCSEFELAYNLGDPDAGAQVPAAWASSRATKYVVKFDILKTEQVAAAQSGLRRPDARPDGGAPRRLQRLARRRGGGHRRRHRGGLGADRRVDQRLDHRHALQDHQRRDHRAGRAGLHRGEDGNRRRRRRRRSASTQSQQGGVSLDTMVQRLVQKSVWEIDSKYK